MNNSKDYISKKKFFDSMLTIYGRNPVVEALEDNSLKIHKLHLADSNRDIDVISKIKKIANSRDIEIAYHNKTALSRISKNAKQDQGVALDIIMPHSSSEDSFLEANQEFRVLALNGIQNPQNLGMIIRSCVAGNIDAIIIEDKNSAKISPLVIKASAGTMFKIPIIKSKNLVKTLKNFDNTDIYTLSSHSKYSYKDENYQKRVIFILGNESDGVSKEIENISTKSIAIPMNRGVESLNVAVTASILAFL
jgi:23S rRNA (guanosine2251-2'-O)-methyltransferase